MRQALGGRAIRRQVDATPEADRHVSPVRDGEFLEGMAQVAASNLR
jgi:hypothetical protein